MTSGGTSKPLSAALRSAFVTTANAYYRIDGIVMAALVTAGGTGLGLEIVRRAVAASADAAAEQHATIRLSLEPGLPIPVLPEIRLVVGRRKAVRGRLAETMVQDLDLERVPGQRQ